MLRTLTAALLIIGTVPIAAQQVREGYGQSLHGLPPGATNPLTLPDLDAVVYFTGTALVLERTGSIRPLLTLPAAVFGSFTLRIGNGQVLFGESSQGGLWLVPLNGAHPPRLVATVPFNYDAIHYAPDLVLVSAKTGGFSAPDNDVVAVDLRTGTVTPLARVPGASGPLTCDPVGNVYYALGDGNFPPPPGAVSVLRWPAARVLAGLGRSLLTPADADLTVTGLDAASDLVLDDDGDLLFVDWWNGTVGEIDDVASGSPRQVTLVDYTGASTSAVSLQLLPASGGSGQFEPFQPPGGGSLLVHESGATENRLRLLAAVRPWNAVAIPGAVPPGPFAVTTDGGPAGGMGILVLHPFAAGRETWLTVPGIEQPLFWDLAMFGALSAHHVSFDQYGHASLALTNPGVPGGLSVAVQCAILDAAGATLGSTPALGLRLD